MISTYGSVIPENLYIACIEATTFHSMSAYMLNRTLRHEFMAKYKNIRSSTNFKKFLHTLPEGVVIIENETTNVKFVNSKFKNYTNDDIVQFENFEQRANDEFDTLMRGSSREDNIDDYKSSIEKILEDFKVIS